jgi:hypothetical protein
VNWVDVACNHQITPNKHRANISHLLQEFHLAGIILRLHRGRATVADMWPIYPPSAGKQPGDLKGSARRYLFLLWQSRLTESVEVAR